MLNGLDLFSGIAGITTGLSEWVRPVAYCEIAKHPRANLLDLQRQGKIPRAPIWNDIRTLKGQYIPVPVDIIYGGFPCQDISVAGNGAGLEGKRSGLFFEIVRLVQEIKPAFIFLENVPAIRTRGLPRVIKEISSLGYDCRWTIVSAAELGAPHLRERWWLLAHANGKQLREQSECVGWSSGQAITTEYCQNDSDSKSEPVNVLSSEERISFRGSSRSCQEFLANATGQGRKRWINAKTAWEAFAERRSCDSGEWPLWLPEPAICRGSDGLSHRVDELKSLGNAVTPQQVQAAFKKLMGWREE